MVQCLSQCSSTETHCPELEDDAPGRGVSVALPVLVDASGPGPGVKLTLSEIAGVPFKSPFLPKYFMLAAANGNGCVRKLGFQPVTGGLPTGAPRCLAKNCSLSLNFI